jgi:hypothetical protein
MAKLALPVRVEEKTKKKLEKQAKKKGIKLSTHVQNILDEYTDSSTK